MEKIVIGIIIVAIIVLMIKTVYFYIRAEIFMHKMERDAYSNMNEFQKKIWKNIK